MSIRNFLKRLLFHGDPGRCLRHAASCMSIELDFWLHIQNGVDIINLRKNVQHGKNV